TADNLHDGASAPHVLSADSRPLARSAPADGGGDDDDAESSLDEDAVLLYFLQQILWGADQFAPSGGEAESPMHSPPVAAPANGADSIAVPPRAEETWIRDVDTFFWQAASPLAIDSPQEGSAQPDYADSSGEGPAAMLMLLLAR